MDKGTQEVPYHAIRRSEIATRATFRKERCNLTNMRKTMQTEELTIYSADQMYTPKFSALDKQLKFLLGLGVFIGAVILIF